MAVKKKKKRKSKKRIDMGITTADRWMIFLALVGTTLLTWWFWQQR